MDVPLLSVSLEASLDEQVLVVPSGDRPRCLLKGVVLDARGRPLPQVSVELHAGAGQYLWCSVDPATGTLIDNPVEATYRIVADCGELGAFELGEHDLTGRDTLDLGTVRAPETGFLEVGGTPPTVATGQVAFHLARKTEGQWRPVVRAHTPPLRRYELLPGNYQARLTVLPGDEVLGPFPVQVESGATTKLELE